MKIVLMGINFNYKDGYEKGYSDVNLNFNNSGSTFNVSGFITVTKEQYDEASGNVEELKELIKQEVLSNIQKED